MEMAILKKENLSLVLMANLNNFNFHQHLLARVCLTKREQFGGHEKVFQIVGIVLGTEQSIKSFTFIFQSVCFNFKSSFTIFKEFVNDFWSEYIFI